MTALAAPRRTSTTSLTLVIGVALVVTATAFAETVIPSTSLIVIAVVGIVARVAAGILPARRAGQLDVLDAIAGE